MPGGKSVNFGGRSSTSGTEMTETNRGSVAGGSNRPSESVPILTGDEEVDAHRRTLKALKGGKKGSSGGILQNLSPRAMVQMFLTFAALGTAIMAFVFIMGFRSNFNNKLSENYEGDLKSNVLPCLRHTLPTCSNFQYFQCWDKCCPSSGDTGYICKRSPTVGLYCQDGANSCGGGDEQKFLWCRDFADIDNSCKSDVCKKKAMVKDMSLPAFFLAGLGVILDIVDVIFFFAAPDSVASKAGINVASACIKFLAFGMVLGAGTQDFMGDLFDNGCFNRDGMNTVQTTGQQLVSFVVSCVISAMLCLMLAPISAYYGGKIIGVPYVK